MADEIIRRLEELKAEMRAGHSAILAKVEANYKLIIDLQKTTSDNFASVAEALEALRVDRTARVVGQR